MRRTGTLAVLLGLFTLAGSSVRADWVTLRSGEHLRGVELRRTDSGYRFTLESGETIAIPRDGFYHLEKSPRSERVEFRGRRVKLAEKVAVLRREREARERELMASLAEWARRGDRDRRGLRARERILGLDPAVRTRVALRALARGRSARLRRFAAKTLPRLAGKDKEVRQRALSGLVRAAIKDSETSVRVSSLAALREWKVPGTAERFFPVLSSPRASERIRATGALALFPHPGAPREIIESMHLARASFGGGHIISATQRAYVADHDLVSGGTGFSIAGVANPIARTTTTGAVLDVDARRVELRVRRAVLKKLTGKDFGDDPAAWRQWLARGGGKG